MSLPMDMQTNTLYEDAVSRAVDELIAVLRDLGVDIDGEEKLFDMKIIPGRPPEGHGHISFPIFPLAKVLKKAPNLIAEDIAEKINTRGNLSDMGSARGEGGYVNIYFSDDYIKRRVLRAIEDGSIGNFRRLSRKVILEHTSANPNGPLHVGRARNPIIGDTMARILRLYGDDVEVQYYVNDMGRQVMTLYWGLKHLSEDDIGEKERDKVDYHYVRYYQKANEIVESSEEAEREILEYIERMETDREFVDEVRSMCFDVLEGMMDSLRRINIDVDRYVWESEFVLNGDVQRVIEKLKERPEAKYDDGALYLDLEDYGISGRTARLYLTRSDGSTLYTTRDIAYHIWKLNEAERVIDVLGEDHKLQSKMLTIALGMLGVEKEPEVLFYSFVSLPEGKMSTRRGRVVYLDDLIDEAIARAEEEVRKRRPELSEDEIKAIARAVGAGAVRFNIVKVHPEKAMTFRWEEALDFEGDSAPFIMYSHARACSILRKAGRDYSVEWTDDLIRALDHPSEIELIEKMMDFQDMVKESAERMKPNALAFYGLELAASFNKFYRDCPVLNAPEDKREARLMLVASFKRLMATVLRTLGLEPLESM